MTIAFLTQADSKHVVQRPTEPGTGAFCRSFLCQGRMFKGSEYLIPASSTNVQILPFCSFLGWKGTNFTHLEDPAIVYHEGVILDDLGEIDDPILQDIATSHASAPEHANSMKILQGIVEVGHAEGNLTNPVLGKLLVWFFPKITGIVQSMEGFHWNMHGICLATLLLTMQFHNQCQAYYTSVILQQHECGTWRKLLIKVAMWPQTQVVQPNFETDEVSHRHGTLRKSHGLIKTRLTPVYQAPMPRFECELSHFGFKLLETPFCIILLITHLSWWLVAMPLCLCAWKDHGLKNCNAFTVCPPCLGTIRFVGRYQWSTLFFFGIVHWPFCWAKGCKKLSNYWVILLYWQSSGLISRRVSDLFHEFFLLSGLWNTTELHSTSRTFCAHHCRAALVKCHEFRWSYFLAHLRVSQGPKN